MSEKLAQLLEQAFGQNIKPFLYLNRQIKEDKYGQKTVTFRFHNGKIVDTTEQTFSRRKWNKQQKI